MGTEIEAVDPLTKIEEIQRGVGDLVIRLTASTTIKTQEDYDKAIAVGVEAKKTLDQFEEYRDKLVRPHNDYVKKSNDMVKLITAPITLPLDNLRKRCDQFLRDKRQAQQDEINRLAKLKAEQDAKAQSVKTPQAKANNEAKAQATAVQIAVVASQKPPAGRTTRKMEIVNADLIPRKYLVVDESAIRRDMGKAGEKIPVIPGVRIFDDVNTVLKG
jgi:hypothetical protein